MRPLQNIQWDWAQKVAYLSFSGVAPFWRTCVWFQHERRCGPTWSRFLRCGQLDLMYDLTAAWAALSVIRLITHPARRPQVFFHFRLNELQRHELVYIYIFFFFFKARSQQSSLSLKAAATRRGRNLLLLGPGVMKVRSRPGCPQTSHSANSHLSANEKKPHSWTDAQLVPCLLLHFNVPLFVPLVHNATLRQAHCAARTT